ncbi:MAG: response regulator, partial [Betaproteobacteria bacterium]
SAAPYKIVVDVDAATFYKEAILFSALLLSGALISLALLARAARRASLGLAAAVRQLSDPAGGPPAGGVPTIAEIEAARQSLLAAQAAEHNSRARERFILELGDALRPLADAGAVKEDGCRMLAQFLDVDRVFFAEWDEDAGVVRVVREALRGQASSVLGDYPRAQVSWALESLSSGQPLAVADTGRSEYSSPEARTFCAGVQATAYLGAPVVKEGHLAAVLCVTHSQPRPWSDEDQVLVKEVSQRLWASTERAQTVEALSARTLELASQTRQLRWLASELTLAEHKTREQLSKTLHDHLQQILFSTSLTLQRAIAKSEGDPILEQARLGLKEAMEAARTLSLEIFPPVLRSEGLPSALRWLATWTQKKYGLAVQVSADPQVDPHAMDVRILLFECVRELLFNVVKHAQAHRVSIEATTGPGQMVQIVLTDDGLGFDPRQAFKSGSDAPGLGLFSIRERLTLLGGELRVESSPGRGSRFTLRAPEQVMPEQVHPAPGQEPSASSSFKEADLNSSADVLRILLVDDHAMVRAGLRQLIQVQSQLEVVGEAVNGMEAIAQARELRPDVVLMDRSMPMLDGLGATRKILAENPAIVVLGMSMDDGDVLQQFEKAGAVGFFSKKDGAEQLLQRLEIERLAKAGALKALISAP